MVRRSNILSGNRFQKLVVEKRVATPDGKSNKYTYWQCKCDCENTIIARGDSLLSGNTKSCGCLITETNIRNSATHKESKTVLYKTWKLMKARCYYKNDKRYSDYGGRGIRVCDKWVNDYIAFRDWAINNGYVEGLSIDRIDTNGNYEPTNCRWATMMTQQNNRRNNVLFTFEGVTKTMSMWCRYMNLKPQTVYSRIKSGWLTEEALDLVERKKG